MQAAGYVGRFAPSPTGRLHMGSLLAAVASWCDAKHHGGTWLVRMEDLDPPREVAGASDDILRTLEGHGLHWDGDVVFQSRRSDLYADALDSLKRDGCVFPCACSRKDLAGVAVYPGTCRLWLSPAKEARLWRFKMGEGTLSWKDLILGETSFEAQNLGDFPVLRADGFWAYQLAVVVDDRDQGVTHVVRGSDLLDSTPRQIQLWSALTNLTSAELQGGIPGYGHLPVLENNLGQKLSKQTLAQPVQVSDAVTSVMRVLQWLNQPVEDMQGAFESGDVHQLLLHAAEKWDRSLVPTQAIQWQGEGQG
ncbi:tRNA glutamyl-Q(34) synthetase GluQRS [Flavobacteriales bacterium]|nr:tRNA glutamyl-Q(34) synthetase GluQRS [Flavobacteriales bacterium]